jgi:hypothetical protein
MQQERCDRKAQVSTHAFQSFRVQGMTHFCRRVAQACTQGFSSWMSHMMCLVAISCQINIQSDLGVGGPAIMFTKHESLQLFPVGLP